MALLRVLGRLVLGLAVLAGLLHFLVFANFTERLVTSEVYYVAINETDAYNRIYDEVLVDEALEDQTGNLLGGIEIEARAEAVALLRKIMPPSYLQEQTENNIDRFTGYMRGETDRLEIYVELEEPLRLIEAAAQAHVHSFIDELEIAEPPEPGCSADTVRRLAADSAPAVARLSDGKPPQSAPSLQLMTRDCRERQFDRWFDSLTADPSLNSQASLLLREAREDLREPFVEGDTRAFLKAAAWPLTKPLIDGAVAEIRRELQPGDRLDLLEQMAANSEDLTREEIEAGAEDLREALTFSNGPAKLIMLALAVAGLLLLALVHLPNPAEMTRWPGIVLALSGGVCLAIGFVLSSAIPGQLNDAVAYSASYSDDVLTSAIRLAGDLMESFGRQATAGFVLPASAVILLGAALIAASFVINALVSAARRILPGGGRGR